MPLPFGARPGKDTRCFCSTHSSLVGYSHLATPSCRRGWAEASPQMAMRSASTVDSVANEGRESGYWEPQPLFPLGASSCLSYQPLRGGRGAQLLEAPSVTGLPPSFLHSEGSNLTPAHHFQDFRFKTYAPVAFRYFRELFGIRPDDYLVRVLVSCCFITS